MTVSESSTCHYAALSDECLERLEQAPSNFAAWVIRVAVQELRERRTEERKGATA